MTSYTSKDNIFHYTKLQTVLEDILPILKLRFNNFSDSHDPREYKDPRIGPKYNVIVYDDDRMKKIQDFITKLLSLNLIQSVALYINVIDMEENNIETLQTNVENFSMFMMDLYERENNWTPVVKIIIRKHSK